MELDKRIKEGKRPLTCFDVEEAKKYIGKDCYFASKFERFENLSKVPHATLHNVDDGPVPFQCYDEDGVFCYDCFILPCEWVKPEEHEKKYRPYTMNEFKAEFKIGMVLTLRNRDTPDYVCQVMYLGNRQYDESDSDNNTIFLSQRFFSLRELFNLFEIVRNGEWQPFGVMEDD